MQLWVKKTKQKLMFLGFFLLRAGKSENQVPTDLIQMLFFLIRNGRLFTAGTNLRSVPANERISSASRWD